MPRISVIVASKVGAPFIDHCLESIKGGVILTLPLTVNALVVLVAGERAGCLLGPGATLSKVE
jgi:hypothetical protein